MKEKSLKADLEAVRASILKNATEMKKALIDVLPNGISDGPHYDNLVHIVIVDGNDTWLSGKLSHIVFDKELGTITFSNFRSCNNGLISERALARQLAVDDIENFDLYDLSIELYNEKSELYASAHVTKIYRNPMEWIYLTNEVNKDLKF